MALKVAIQESKNVSLWREYKDDKGTVLARFKIRGSEYQAYQVAMERAQHQIISKGYEIDKATVNDKTAFQLTLEAVACHLIEDWEGVEFEENGKIVEQPYSHENATKLFHMGDIGFLIWAFVKSESEKIQKELNQTKEETLGKSESSTSGKQNTGASQTTKRNRGKRSTSPS